MLDLSQTPDQCDAEEAVSTIASLAPMLGIGGDLPDVRTLRLWRTKRLLTINGRHLTRRNILEILVMLKLREDGLNQQAASKQVLALNEVQLRHVLQPEEAQLHQLLEAGEGAEGTSGSDLPVPSMRPKPIVTLQLLASGIMAQYHLARKGAIVGHTDRRVTGMDNTPETLRQAMAQLGYLYFAEDKDDLAASVHQLLRKCTKSLDTWAPQALLDVQDGHYRDAVLIDADYHDDPVPSEDCETIVAEIAARQGQVNLSNLLEHELHDQLRDTLKVLSTEDADRVYTEVRKFVGSHPLASDDDFRQLAADQSVPTPAYRFVTQHLYEPVHAWDSPDGQVVRRCAYCNGLITASRTGGWARGVCCLPGCRDDNSTTKDAEPIPLAQASIARPDALKYWADPAREELRLFKELCKVSRLRERGVFLYPHCDKCDVSVGEEAGVDVKDYRDPVRLAQRLNRYIGQLTDYSLCILAVADRRARHPAYLDLLKEHLSSERRRQLLVMSVSDALAYLKKYYR